MPRRWRFKSSPPSIPTENVEEPHTSYGLGVAVLVFGAVSGAFSSILLAASIDKDLSARIILALLLTPVLVVVAVALTYPGCALMIGTAR